MSSSPPLYRVALVLLFFFADISLAEAQSRFALLIGNQKYTDKVGPLKNPHNDVRIIKDALVEIGFKERDITLVDDADLKAIHSSIGRFQQQLRAAGESALGFFYYSGHGAANRTIAEDGTAANYIVPTDVADSEGLDIFFATSVQLNHIVRDLRTSAPHADLIVIFDACRNELRLSFKSPNAKTFMVENMPFQGNTLLAFATEPNNLASDEGALSGPFAAALASELRKTNEHHEQIFFNVKAAVWETTNHRQRPWYLDQSVKRLYLSGTDIASTARSSEPYGSATAWGDAQTINSDDAIRRLILTAPNSDYAFEPNARLPLLEEDDDWRALSTSNKLDDFERFLKKHPYGLYASTAREQYANLLRADEQRAWGLARTTGTADAFVSYVRKYPLSANYAEALDALAKLRTIKIPTSAGPVDEAAAWDKAKQANTEGAYESYLKTYKDGPNALSAHKMIATLTEAKGWSTAETTNTVEGFKQFLTRFAGGPHASLAQSKIDELQRVEEEAWRAAQASGTEASYQLFIQANNSGRHIAEAVKRIDQLHRIAMLQKPGSSSLLFDEVNNLFFPKASFRRLETGRLSELIDFNRARPTRRLILSNDLSRLYTGGDDGSLRIWDLNSVVNSSVLQPRHNDKIYALARSSNSKYLATGSWDRSVFLWDTYSNERTAAVPVRPKVFSMAFSPTGRWIAAAGSNGDVDFISTAKSRVVNHRHTSSAARIHAIAYLPNKSEDLIVGDAKGSLRIWSVRKGNEKFVQNAHGSEIFSLAVDPAGTTIASAGVDKKLKLWDRQLKLVREIPEAHTHYITALRFTPERQYIASGGGDHVVRIWDTKTGRRVFGPFVGHTGDVEEIEFSPDGRYMFTSSEDKTIKIWDVGTGKVLYTFVAFLNGQYIIYDADQRYLSSKAVETQNMKDINTRP